MLRFQHQSKGVTVEFGFVQNFIYTSFHSVPFQQHRAYMHGSRGGLSLLLKYPNNEKPFNRFSKLWLEMGFKILVHPNVEFPNEETVGKLTPVNREYYISVKPTETVCSEQVRQLTIEDRQCVFSEERPSQYFSRYSEVNCEYECRIHRIHNLCGCIPYTFFQMENIPICNFTRIPCITDNWGMFCKSL